MYIDSTVMLAYACAKTILVVLLQNTFIPTYLVILLHFSDISQSFRSSVSKQLFVLNTKHNIAKCDSYVPFIIMSKGFVCCCSELDFF